MRKLAILLALSFLFYIFWVIYRADIGQPTSIHVFITSVPYGDKVGHFFIFGLLALLGNLALKLRQITIGSLRIYVASVLVFTFAIVEELSQAFFPDRTLDLVDAIAGILGILVLSLLSKPLAKCL